MWNAVTFLWNELTILWNDLTTDWNDLTWNDLTMERNDRIPSSQWKPIKTLHLTKESSQNKNTSAQSRLGEHGPLNLQSHLCDTIDRFGTSSTVLDQRRILEGIHDSSHSSH